MNQTDLRVAEDPEERKRHEVRYPYTAHKARDAWQPIETAPKDGEVVILTEGGKVFHGGFITIDFKEIRDSEGNFIDQSDPDASWMNFDEGDVCTPTHWMPKRSLPMPPGAAIEAKQGGAAAPAKPAVQGDALDAARSIGGQEP